MLLAVDTSTRYAGVALADGGRVVSCRCWFTLSSHTTELMPAVAATLQGQGVSPQDLDGIAIALGPGGFSALRVGMSVAKGLAMSSKTPLLGVGTLELEALTYLRSGLPVCALLDAGRQEVASAHFDADGRPSREDLICPPEELLSTINAQTIFCGEGMTSWADFIKERLGTLAVTVSWAPALRLYSLAELGQQRLDAGEADDVVTLQPYYLRMPSIGGPKRRDRQPQRSSSPG